MNRKRKIIHKKRVVSTLFLFLALFHLGCEFESPNKWETPTWYLPLSFPLINTEYSFSVIVDSSMLFSDSVSNMIQIVFGDSLPANGIPDETFNIDMSTGGLDAPDIGMSDIGIKVESNIALPEIPIEVKDDAGLFNTFDCFPETQIESVQSIIDAASDLMQGSIELPISFDSNESVSIKSINVTEGIWNMDVSNEFAVPISVIFTLINNESTLYKADFSGETKISPYSTENKNILITNTAPSQIVISESINYFAEIKILDESHDCIGYECSVGGLGYLIESDCNTACTLLGGTCTQYNGWTVDKSKTENLKINFSATFDKIGSVVADVNIEAPSSEPLAIDIPAMEGISITRAKFANYTETYPNQFKFNITNGFIADLLMKMSYKNIFDYDSLGIDSIQLTDSLILPFTISPGTTLDTTISISDKFLAYGSTSEEPVKSIEIGYEVDIASGEYTINVENDSIKIGVPKINTIDVTNMRLEYIAAVTDSLPFPAIESPPIEGIPDGFSGFEFYDIIMEIEFFNEIGVPVGLDMEMLGSKTGVTDTQKVTISTEIGAPYKYNYNCQFSTTGDTARTLIKINKDFQITQYYCSPDAEEASMTLIDSLNNSPGTASIVDLMNFAPENIGIGGGVVIDGPGVLAPGSQIWGTFTLIAPLAFVFKNPMTIIPAEASSMAPMDPSTSEQIDSALVEAALNVTITNRSPLGGNLSLLISDSTVFPLFLDSLITGSWESNRSYQMENYGYYFDTSVWDTLRPELSEVIDSVYFTAIDSAGKYRKALEVKFFKEDSLQFFIGRMFELGFPATDSIDYHLGFVNPEFPEVYNSNVSIDTTRMNWLFTEENRYNISMITFDGSPIQSATENDTSYIPLTFQTTNTIGVQAYLTLTLDTGGLGRERDTLIITTSGP